MKLTRRQDDLGQRFHLNPLNRLREEIDRVFSSPLAGYFPSSELFDGWTPSVDLYEDKNQIVVKAELPGMKKENIEVSLHGEMLTIAGERKHEEESHEGDRYRSERYFGRFHRSITLPRAVDGNQVKATYKDGVLTITLAKTEEAKRKEIDVKVI
jgi:HSP20 family protein